ncbi:F-box/kelch-repeat protein [Hibiscus syriacus]|uniref:F-box/kelch-repeat protein n=1 Tax=Hibiscus syriacus TaxID=106335 RepID=A0A6A2Y556_HIBSY|nr:F-box/kelch-repeat protein [Hibiscus syriacus]
MATPGHQLAEVYVMQKLHKEKMKREEEEEEEEAKAKAKTEDVGFAVKESSGCFPSIFNKVHPGQASTLDHVINEEKDHDKNKAG